MPIDIPKKVREFAGMAEALAELVEIADKHNALVQFEAEHCGRVNKLRDAEADIQGRIVASDLRIADAQAKALEITEQAKADAETIKAKAASEADQIREAANQAVDNAKAKERRAEVDQRKAEKELAEITGKIEAAGRLLAESQAIIAKAEQIKKAMA